MYYYQKEGKDISSTLRAAAAEKKGQQLFISKSQVGANFDISFFLRINWAFQLPPHNMFLLCTPVN